MPLTLFYSGFVCDKKQKFPQEISVFCRAEYEFNQIALEIHVNKPNTKLVCKTTQACFQ